MREPRKPAVGGLKATGKLWRHHYCISMMGNPPSIRLMGCLPPGSMEPAVGEGGWTPGLPRLTPGLLWRLILNMFTIMNSDTCRGCPQIANFWGSRSSCKFNQGILEYINSYRSYNFQVLQKSCFMREGETCLENSSLGKKNQEVQFCCGKMHEWRSKEKRPGTGHLCVAGLPSRLTPVDSCKRKKQE